MNRDKIVDEFNQGNVSFVLYRAPKEEGITLLVDENPESVSLEDFSFQQSGFVFFPFDSSQEKGVYFNANKKNELTQQEVNKLDFSNYQELTEESGLSTTSLSYYTKGVVEAIGKIGEDELKKVVLSKVKKEPLDSLNKLVEAVFLSYPNAFVYVTYTPQYGVWLGATPETLLCQNGDEIKTVALAGTQSAVGKEEKEAQWTQKEIEEQALVSRYIINCFKKIRLREFEDVGPKTVKAGELFHLKTEFFINEKHTTYTDLFGQLVRLLHPTSAVCGMKLEVAKEFIEQFEQNGRQLFTGICGPINMKGKSHLFVNLRSAKIVNEFIYAFAGAGITIDSDPKKEWEETELKCETILSLLKYK